MLADKESSSSITVAPDYDLREIVVIIQWFETKKYFEPNLSEMYDLQNTLIRYRQSRIMICIWLLSMPHPRPENKSHKYIKKRKKSWWENYSYSPLHICLFMLRIADKILKLSIVDVCEIGLGYDPCELWMNVNILWKTSESKHYWIPLDTPKSHSLQYYIYITLKKTNEFNVGGLSVGSFMLAAEDCQEVVGQETKPNRTKSKKKNPLYFLHKRR